MELLMRALVLLVVAACTPDIVSGSYLCGPESSCPDGQVCNGTEDEDAGLIADTCVIESLARPFACEPTFNSEPDNSLGEAYLIPNLGCVSAPFLNDGCLPANDSADWVTFVAPSVCTAVMVQARVTFPIAYQTLGLELWNVDANMKLGGDSECASGADTGGVRRCLDMTLVPGTKYGVKVTPTGQGNCAGTCAYNRYTLSVQLATPG
jgi:hypothetical protein